MHCVFAALVRIVCGRQAACLAFEVHSHAEHYWAGDAADMAADVFEEQTYDGGDLLMVQVGRWVGK